MVLPGCSFVVEFVRLVGKRIGGESLTSTAPFLPKSLISLINVSNHARQYISYDYKSEFQVSFVQIFLKILNSAYNVI